MYLISAYFDSTTTKQLKRIIDTLAVQTGNDYMTENEVPPHLTISSFETRNPKNLNATVRIRGFRILRSVKN